MIQCPFCAFQTASQRGLASHFRHQSDTHPDYARWKEDQRFNGKVEGQDFVRCLICGHRAETLARHLKAAHGVTAAQYKVQFPGALIRCTATTSKRQHAARNRKGGFGKGDTKEIVCPECGTSWAGSKFLVPGTHDLRCPVCREQAEDARWADKSEPEDYVTCLECGHRAENLTSHIQNAHPGYRDRHPDALMVALFSAVGGFCEFQGSHQGDRDRPSVMTLNV